MESDRHRPSEKIFEVSGSRMMMTNGKCQVAFLP
jgi:hypothetical protein